MISNLELQKLRDLPIEEVAERLGLQVTRHKSLCPFHDDHNASLSYKVSKNTCRCFVCMDKSLGTIDLVMRYLNKDFKEACEWLADGSLSMTLPKREGAGSCQMTEKRTTFDPSRYARFFEHPNLSPEACHFLFDVRKLDPRVIGWCRITSWRDRNGVNWLQIPYFDVDGKLIGLQNRNLNPSRPPQRDGGGPSRPPQRGGDLDSVAGWPRFMFPYGSRCSIYNLPILRYLKPGGECWIAEGCSDAWALCSDHKKAIAIASATLLQPKDKELLQEVTARLSIRWRMSPDSDEPGRKLASQLKEILPNLEIVPLPEGVKDYSDSRLLRLSQGGDADASF